MSLKPQHRLRRKAPRASSLYYTRAWKMEQSARIKEALRRAASRRASGVSDTLCRGEATKIVSEATISVSPYDNKCHLLLLSDGATRLPTGLEIARKRAARRGR
jgi:hypothetical protein